MAKKTKMDAPKPEDDQKHLSPLQALAEKSRPTVKDLMKATEAEIVDRQDRTERQINVLSGKARFLEDSQYDAYTRHKANSQAIQDQGRLLLAALVVSFASICISIVAVLS